MLTFVKPWSAIKLHVSFSPAGFDQSSVLLNITVLINANESIYFNLFGVISPSFFS